MTIVWCGLAPHPPIIVEGVGGLRQRDAQATIEAMKLAMVDLMASKPEGLVVISPHTPRPAHGVGYFSGRLCGDFLQFGAPRSQVDLPGFPAWQQAFLADFPYGFDLGSRTLDHGAAVPLWFVQEAGWRGPTAVLGLPMADERMLVQMGLSIKSAAEQVCKRIALIASGDMSHSLTPEAPCGWREDGPAFDHAFVACLRQGDYRGAQHVDQRLQAGANQDVVESCIVTWTATEYCNAGRQFYTYEGPFGVGYTVMKFMGVS